MIFHYSKVDSIARGQPRVPQHNIFGALDRNPIHGQDLIDHAKQGIECRLNGIEPVNRNVAVQDFLQDFRIRYEPLALADQFFKQSLRVSLVKMWSAYQIHGDIRVDQNHGFVPAP